MDPGIEIGVLPMPCRHSSFSLHFFKFMVMSWYDVLIALFLIQSQVSERETEGLDFSLRRT